MICSIETDSSVIYDASDGSVESILEQDQSFREWRKHSIDFGHDFPENIQQAKTPRNSITTTVISEATREADRESTTAGGISPIASVSNIPFQSAAQDQTTGQSGNSGSNNETKVSPNSITIIREYEEGHEDNQSIATTDSNAITFRGFKTIAEFMNTAKTVSKEGWEQTKIAGR